MILRVPSYYKTFQCIADKCEHSCCIGWEIDIDEDSYDYYMGIEGAFGERLKEQTVTEDGEHSFVLRKNGWCPFLDHAIFTANLARGLCVKSAPSIHVLLWSTAMSGKNL